jgi:Tfp pilus assembly protein PilZ
MTPWNGLNRRRFPRIKYPCLVTFRNPDEVLLTHTENLGIGGVGLMVKKNVKIFSEVILEIDLMDLQEHIKCRGKVVWAIRHKEQEGNKPLMYDIGIEFVDVGPGEVQRLEKVVQHLARTRPETIV